VSKKSADSRNFLATSHQSLVPNQPKAWYFYVQGKQEQYNGKHQASVNHTVAAPPKNGPEIVTHPRSHAIEVAGQTHRTPTLRAAFEAMDEEHPKAPTKGTSSIHRYHERRRRLPLGLPAARAARDRWWWW